LSLVVWQRFDASDAAFQLIEEKAWFGSGLVYKLASTLLDTLRAADDIPDAFSILASWESITKRVAEYMIAFLVLETLMIGVFCALDLVLFYLFFEGASFRCFSSSHLGRQAARLCELQILSLHARGFAADADRHSAMYNQPHDRHSDAAEHAFFRAMQTWLWLAFFRLLRGENAMWPVHTWLRTRMSSADRGSVILAAILLKMGAMASSASRSRCSGRLRSIRAAGLRLVGYRHYLHLARRAGAGRHQEADRLFVVAHMGFVTMGLFTLNTQGVQARCS